MDIDMSLLRMLEREKEIPFEQLIDALETALLSAYRHTAHSMPHARVVIDRSSGQVIVWAQDLDDAGQIVEVNTPDAFFSDPQHERTRLFLGQILH